MGVWVGGGNGKKVKPVNQIVTQLGVLKKREKKERFRNSFGTMFEAPHVNADVAEAGKTLLAKLTVFRVTKNEFMSNINVQN